MLSHILELVAGVCACMAVVFATSPSQKQPQTIIIQPQSTSPGASWPPISASNTCPAPSEEMLRCIRQWACQYIIRLDLRCLLNLNGNPLLGNLLGGGGTSSATAGSGGLLGGILGL